MDQMMDLTSSQPSAVLYDAKHLFVSPRREGAWGGEVGAQRKPTFVFLKLLNCPLTRAARTTSLFVGRV